MRIQSFRVEIDNEHDAVADQLHDGLNVIERDATSRIIGQSLADRLFGIGGDATAHESFRRTQVSLTNNNMPITLASDAPAALAEAHVSSADLPVLRDMYCLSLDGGHSQWLQPKPVNDACLCGRQDCDASLHDTNALASGASTECRRRLEQARAALLVELKRTREVSQRKEQQWKADDHRLSESIAHARKRIESLRVEIRAIEAKIEALSAEIAGWEAERKEIEALRNDWRFASGLSKLESQLAEYDGNLNVLGNETLLVERIPQSNDRCRYLRRAADYLQQLTGGYLVDIVAPHSASAAATFNRHGERFAWESLSISGRNMVKLALSLAAAESWQQHGLELPLVVEDPFTHLKAGEVGYVIDCLKRFASSGRQVLLFADQEVIERYFAGRHVRIRGIETRPPAEPPVTVENDIDTEIDEIDDAPVTVTASQQAAPKLTPKQRLVAALRSAGIESTVAFLDADPVELAEALQSHGYTAGELRRWQDRIALLHFVPELTDSDLEVLVACDCDTLEKLSTIEVDLLHERMLRFLRSEGGSDYRRLRTRFQRSRIRDWRKLSRRRRGDWSRGAYGRRLAARKRRADEAVHPATIKQPPRNPSAAREHVKLHEAVEQQSDSHETAEARFYLDRSSPIVDAPTIGPKMAERLEAIGIYTVDDLLTNDADTIASQLNHSRTKAEHIEQWQQQSALMCRVPQLRGHDAQILVALGYLEPDQIAAMSPQQLFAEVKPFCRTKEGKRIVRTMSPPDLEEVTEWIDWTRQARSLKAA